MVRARGLGVLIVAAFVAFACGGGGGGTGSKGTIKIGSDLPVCSTGGQSTANGVKFAVDQKNAAGGVNGYTISYQSFDDCRQAAYSADAGVENVQSMLGSGPTTPQWPRPRFLFRPRSTSRWSARRTPTPA